MTIRCEKVKELLEKFHDQELRGKKFDEVNEHLKSCETCSHELERLRQMSSMLKSHCEEVARSQDFSGLWNRVSEAIDSSEAVKPKTFRERLSGIFSLPKPIYALAGATAAAVLALFIYLSSGPSTVLAANDCVIDSVDADNGSVMVYETGPTKMKIIWVMEQTSQESGENSQESTSEEGVAS